MVRAIVHFRDQLKERGIEVLVVPVPGKPSVHPEMLWWTAGRKGSGFSSPTLALMQKLYAKGVSGVDLLDRFHRAREEKRGDELYLAQDTHWTPEGASLAGEAVAEKLRSLGWAPEPTVDFQSRMVRVRRYGDVLEMIEPGSSQDHFPYEEVDMPPGARQYRQTSDVIRVRASRNLPLSRRGGIRFGAG